MKDEPSPFEFMGKPTSRVSVSKVPVSKKKFATTLADSQQVNAKEPSPFASVINQATPTAQVGTKRHAALQDSKLQKKVTFTEHLTDTTPKSVRLSHAKHLNAKQLLSKLQTGIRRVQQAAKAATSKKVESKTVQKPEFRTDESKDVKHMAHDNSAIHNLKKGSSAQYKKLLDHLAAP